MRTKRESLRAVAVDSCAGRDGKKAPNMSLDTKRLARELLQPVHAAGACIMQHYGRPKVALKDDRSPVTDADREADTILVKALADLAPGIAVVAEESSPHITIEPHEPFFLVDPLDGTREFISARTEFTVNVALIEKQRPVFGMVYAPALSLLYLTHEDNMAAKALLDPNAAFPGSDALALTQIATRPVPQGGPTAAVSRSHLDDATRAYIEEHGITDTFASGSSLKFCCIADGQADVYPRFGRTMEWDTAAGHAVLRAAGGEVTGTGGEAFLYGKTSDSYANPGFIAWGRFPGQS